MQYVDSSSEWTVTGDSTLTNLYNEGSIVDAQGNQVSIVGTDGTVYVEGTSEYTVTVDAYAEQADLSEVQTAPVWSDYEAAVPEQLTAVSSSDSETAVSASDTGEAASVLTSQSDTASSSESESETDMTDSHHSNIPVYAGIGVAALILCGWYIGRRKK